jgi:replication factor C small subunit
MNAVALAVDPNEFVWAQKYRPRTVAECILPEDTKAMVKELLARGEIPHMLFSGGPGMGKTTLAYAIANELGSDVMYINASLENGIDMLRTKIQSFASTVSLSDSGPKIVILDEADGMTGAIQGALKGFLEAFSANCRFIFTANHKHKIIEPIHSRCTTVDFKIKKSEKGKILVNILRRTCQILDLEGVTYDKAVVAKVVEKNFPDFRQILNDLQRHGVSGEIDTSILANINNEMAALIDILKRKSWVELRNWVFATEIDEATMFRSLVDSQEIDIKSKPQLIIILNECQKASPFVADKPLNTLAALTEVMGTVKVG